MTPLSESEQAAYDAAQSSIRSVSGRLAASEDVAVHEEVEARLSAVLLNLIDRLLSESSEGVVVLDGKRWRVGKPRREYCGCDRFASVDCGPACSCGHESAAHAPPPFDDCRASVSVARLIPADPEPPKTEGA